MATIKSYTDFSQSKKLAEILPIETADMCYIAHSELVNIHEPFYKKADKEDTPCWSLASLLGVLPEYNLQRTDWGNKAEYKIVVYVDDNDNYASKNYNNPLDACYELILKLHELNFL